MVSQKFFSRLQEFYHGFTILQPVGNNAFSYDDRQQKSIFVPSLIAGTPIDLALGDQPAFCEIEGGVERICCGLQNFVYFRNGEQDVFIFDNHNHAFFFWIAAYICGRFPAGSDLLHVDQHSDMRQPQKHPPFTLNRQLDLEAVFRYSQQDLNVGNFIRPALQLGLFQQVQIIDSSSAFYEEVPSQFVLDIDIDVFAPEMAYIDDDLKLQRIRQYLQKASFVTIATSPFFIDQQLAISIIRRLFASTDPPL